MSRCPPRTSNFPCSPLRVFNLFFNTCDLRFRSFSSVPAAVSVIRSASASSGRSLSPSCRLLHRPDRDLRLLPITFASTHSSFKVFTHCRLFHRAPALPYGLSQGNPVRCQLRSYRPNSLRLAASLLCSGVGTHEGFPGSRFSRISRAPLACPRFAHPRAPIAAASMVQRRSERCVHIGRSCFPILSRIRDGRTPALPSFLFLSPAIPFSVFVSQLSISSTAKESRQASRGPPTEGYKLDPRPCAPDTRRRVRARVCARKHITGSRVRRSKARTRETQFERKERESGDDDRETAATVLRFSRATHWVARVSVRRS